MNKKVNKCSLRSFCLLKPILSYTFYRFRCHYPLITYLTSDLQWTALEVARIPVYVLVTLALMNTVHWQLLGKLRKIVALVQVAFCLITFAISSFFTFSAHFPMQKIVRVTSPPCFDEFLVMKTNFSEGTLTKSRNLSKRRTLKMLRSLVVLVFLFNSSCMLLVLTRNLDKNLLNT